MFDLSKVDNNFEIKTQIDRKDIKFYKIDDAPFRIYGVFRENEKYRRMPENIAKKVSDGVYKLHTHTAGGRVRFATESPYIVIYAKMDGVSKMPHFALTGSAGFDL